MTEALLFLVVGAVAVAAAVMMLLSENAVYSALFLIINFMCVAFFYLMLDAPFLMMIQIAVYAGAIMVLFLFVIMLLGAEKLGEPTREFRWLAPLALALSVAFLVITGIAITQGQIDLQGPQTQPPLVRVAHAASNAGPVDVYADGQLIAEDVAFKEASGFLPLAAGEHTITLNAAGTDTALLSAPLTLENDPERTVSAFTLVAYGDAPAVSLIPNNLETTEDRSGRLTIFNAFDRPVDLWDMGSEFNPDDDRAITSDLAPGASVELPAISENTDLRAWRFTEAGSKEAALFRLNNPDVFRIRRDEAQMLVLVSERVLAGTEQDLVRAVAVPLLSRALPSFGGPQAVGELLFTRYMLPLQLVAVLLLVAMIGAIVLTHKEDFRPRRRDVRRRVAKPLAAAISTQVGRDVLQPGVETPKLPPQEEEQPQPVVD